MKYILWKKVIEVRIMAQKQLGYEVKLECIEKTIKNTIGFMQYCKYIVCKKSWVNEKITCNRKTYVEKIKKRYPKPKNLHYMRFGHKVHLKYGP